MSCVGWLESVDFFSCKLCKFKCNPRSASQNGNSTDLGGKKLCGLFGKLGWQKTHFRSKIAGVQMLFTISFPRNHSKQQYRSSRSCVGISILAIYISYHWLCQNSQCVISEKLLLGFCIKFVMFLLSIAIVRPFIAGFEIRRFRKKLKVKKTQSRGKKLKLRQIFEKTQVIFWKTQ